MNGLLKNSYIRTILLAWCMSLVSNSFAQNGMFVGVGSTFYNTNNVYVRGDIRIAGQGTNYGAMALTRDFTLNFGGSYVSTGRDSFAGPGVQHVTNSVVSPNSFGDFYKANAAGNITLDASIDTRKIIFLTNGRIDASGGHTVTVTDDTPGAISGYNSNRYFLLDDNVGDLNRNIGSTALFAFPVGNTGVGYHRIDLDFSDLGATGSGYVSVKTVTNPGTGFYFNKYYPTGFSGNFPATCVPGTNDQWVEFTCIKNDFWRFNGAADYEYIAYAHAPACDPAGQGPRRVLWSTPTTNFWIINVENVVGSVTQNLCENSDWTGAAPIIPGGTYLSANADLAIAGGYGSPLPVELISFTASPIDNKYVLLTWATATELNCYEFVLQRSTDATNWTTITHVPGHGTTNEPQNYLFEDYDVMPGILYYYRIIQIDFDRSAHQHPYVSCRLKSIDIIEVKNVYPNPGNIQQWLPVFLPKQEIITLLYINALGQEVRQEKIEGKAFSQNILLDNSIADGTYYLKVQIGEYSVVRKYIKQ